MTCTCAAARLRDRSSMPSSCWRPLGAAKRCRRLCPTGGRGGPSRAVSGRRPRPRPAAVVATSLGRVAARRGRALTARPRACLRIDTSRAPRSQGVVCVATAADVRPSVVRAVYDDGRLRREGEEVRASATCWRRSPRSTPGRTGGASLRSRRVRAAAAVLHPADGSRRAPAGEPEAPNCCRDDRAAKRRGRGAPASAHVLGQWRTQRIEHLYLEPECALAEVLPDGRCTWTQGQGSSTTGGSRASSSACPRTAVVELVPNGGAFAAGRHGDPGAGRLLAWLTAPDPSSWNSVARSPSASTRTHRSPMEYTVGCDAEAGSGGAREDDRDSAVRVGGGQGAGASAATRAAPTGARRSRSVGARRYTNTRVRRHAWLRRQTRRTSPWREASTCLCAKTASTRGRSAGQRVDVGDAGSHAVALLSAASGQPVRLQRVT